MTTRPRNALPSSVLIKPAGPDCNLSCVYCFYRGKSELFPGSKTHRMSDDVLRETIRQVLTQGGPAASFSWQGGEPTLMGLPFFERAVDYQKLYGRGKRVGNGLQTNGILIDREWSRFLRRYRFLVGLSLDGPEHIHDRYRILANGQGSWKQVMESAKRMLDDGVEVNALCLVNDYSARFPEEIYAFLKETGLAHMQFIPCVEPDPEDRTKPAVHAAPADAFGRFLCRVFDLWMDDHVEGRPTTFVRFFDSVFYSYVGLEPPDCSLLRECGIYLVVEHNGEVYACDFFVEPRWSLGNVMERKLVDMLNSGLQREFGRRKAELARECRDCRWIARCAGGCTKDRVRYETGDASNHFCDSYRMFFEHADERLRLLARDWRKKPGAAPSPAAAGGKRPGRNDPCPCGSGRKFKKCCGTGPGPGPG